MISRLAKCALLRGSSKKEKGTKNNSLISHQEKKESDLLLIDGKEIVYWKLDHELPRDLETRNTIEHEYHCCNPTQIVFPYRSAMAPSIELWK